MTAEDALRIAQKRGFTVIIKDDGPHLIGNGNEATEPLLKVLQQHRSEIIEKLKARENQEDKPTCQQCKGKVDHKGVCWQCRNRPCTECGLMTGSEYISICLRCEGRQRGGV